MATAAPSESTLEARLQRLEDIESIRQLKARYCAGCDADHDPALLGPLFHDDAVWEASGIGRFAGREAITGYFSALRATGRIRNSEHCAMNPIIDINGDTATGHWRLLMLYTANVPGSAPEFFRIIGWYREQYRRLAGEWRFQSLFCQVEEHAAYRLKD
jgi:SnoaL-like domain